VTLSQNVQLCTAAAVLLGSLFQRSVMFAFIRVVVLYILSMSVIYVHRDAVLCHDVIYYGRLIWRSD